MTFIGAGMGLGQPSTGLRFATTRGRIQGSPIMGMNYPSPFFDVAHTYLPTTVKQLFRWCRYYFLTNPLINVVSYKLAEYPVTDVIIDNENAESKRQWEEYLQDHLRYRAFQIEFGLDYNVYGNGFCGLSFPFFKYLRCRGCGYQEQARKIRDRWVFTNYQFRLTCPECGMVGEAEVKDDYVRDPSGVRLIRWNPEDIEISYNDLSGNYTYFYNIPGPLRSDIVVGKKDVVEQVPQVFVQALRQQKGVVFNKGMLFHMRRPTLANQDRGWGQPLILPVLKDAFYLQLMKKSQECVAPNTLIETESGLLPAAEVQVGTLVRTHMGRLRPVTQKRVRSMVPDRGDYAVELSISGMRKLPNIFSDNHPLWVLRRNEKSRRVDTKERQRSSRVLSNQDLYEFTWVHAGDVRVGDYVGYPTQRVEEEQTIDLAAFVDMTHTADFVYSGVGSQTAIAFEELERGGSVPPTGSSKVAKRAIQCGRVPKRFPRFIELDEDLAYIAGWYVGDGSVGARRVDFSMGPGDDGVELQEAVDRVFGASFSRYGCKKSEGWLLSFFDTIMSDFFHSWIPGDAKSKRIPKEILLSPRPVVLAFLRGYVEADGHTELRVRNDERVSVCCASQQLTYQLWSLALSLGCISTLSAGLSYDSWIVKRDGTAQHVGAGRDVYFWTVSSKSARRLVQLMQGEEPETVTSGKSGFFVHGYFAARINSVGTVDCPEVVSLEVEEDHTFCTAGMATHNSILLEHIVPLRILFPQAGSGSSDPFTTINLDTWRDHVAQEIARWRFDCVSPETLVEAQEGLVPADEVKEGDLLKNYEGTYSKVEKVWRRPLREGEKSYRVTIGGGATGVFSEGHPLYAISTRAGPHVTGTPEFIRVRNLREGDFVGYPDGLSGHVWTPIVSIQEESVREVVGFQLSTEEGSVCLDDGEVHGTFCTWGMAGGNSNYIPLLPLPIGQETIGGDGRALLLTQELQVVSEQLINGMQCTREFIFGGGSYAGSSVSARMMENSFLGYILNHKSMLRWVIENVASYLHWPVVRGRFKPFKMADDIQRTALILQANQLQKVSDTTFLTQLDLSQEEENKIMLRETASRLEATEKQQLAMADIQGKAQMVMIKYQTKAQMAAQVDMQQPQAPGEPGGSDNLQEGTPGGQGMAAPGEGAMGGAESPMAITQSRLNMGQRAIAPRMDLQSMAMAQAQMLKGLPPDQRDMALQNLQMQSPELAEVVRQLLKQMVGVEEEQQGASPAVDMRPLPEKLPPRRAAQII